MKHQQKHHSNKNGFSKADRVRLVDSLQRLQNTPSHTETETENAPEMESQMAAFLAKIQSQELDLNRLSLEDIPAYLRPRFQQAWQDGSLAAFCVPEWIPWWIPVTLAPPPPTSDDDNDDKDNVNDDNDNDNDNKTRKNTTSWQTTVPCRPRVTATSDVSSSSLAATDSQFDADDLAQLPRVPLDSLPPLSSLLPRTASGSTGPSPLLYFSAVNLLFSYAFTIRRFNGDFDSDPTDASRVCVYFIIIIFWDDNGY